MGDFLAVPWFLPAVAVWLVVGLVTASRIAAGLRIRAIHAFALVLSFGVIFSATLTPQWAAVAHGATGPTTCDLSRLGLASLREYLLLGDTGGNVLMFAPLGVALGLLPRSRDKVVLIVAAVILPLGIETTQLMLGFLDRACQSGDVVDNVAGLVVGLVVGSLIGAAAGVIRGVKQ